MNDLSIIPYEPRYQPDFKRLNLEWIETYFAVEPHDMEQLDQPEVYILPNGGQIFLARGGAARTGDGQIIGCVAVIRTGPAEFELAKMAVSPAAQGQGAGKRLGQQAIDYARQLGAGMIWLESNRVLMPALTMYAALGFVEVPNVPTPYARADIRMEMTLRETIIHY
jgi:putative acetyltransferase